WIGFGTIIVHRDARLGERVSIGVYCVIGRADVGAGVRIASRVSVTSGRHQHGSGADGVHAEGERFEPVGIGADAWIGEGAIVMADVGRGAIVGAGSVVTRPVAPDAVVAGNPARELLTPMARLTPSSRERIATLAGQREERRRV